MGQPTDSEYLPMSIHLLVSGNTNTFDVYVRHGRDGKEYLLYCPKGRPFSEEHRQRLLDWGMKDLFVRTEEQGAYQEYLARNLERFLEDPSVDLGKKGEIIYETCTYNMKQVFEHPKADFIQKSKGTMQHTIDYIIRANKDAVQQMIQVIRYDRYTFQHSVNVGLLGTSLLKEILGTSDKDLHEIGYALFLHDIGKTGIDSGILNKPGRLTPNEWEIMKTHTEKGYRLLSAEKHLTRQAEIVTLQHHERSDGTGYPQGLQSEQIDPLAKICNIVDTYDALMARRAYKEPMTPFQALKLMKEEMREQFDRGMFERFVWLLG
jgi:HD-GYP domain-containing protein (c-di-GMP phosphodiesterase class II)